LSNEVRGVLQNVGGEFETGNLAVPVALADRLDVAGVASLLDVGLADDASSKLRIVTERVETLPHRRLLAGRATEA
jgi:hypothetical protein